MNEEDFPTEVPAPPGGWPEPEEPVKRKPDWWNRMVAVVAGLVFVGFVSVILYASNTEPTREYPTKAPATPAPTSVSEGQLPTKASTKADAEAMLAIFLAQGETGIAQLQQVIRAKYPTCAVAAGAVPVGSLKEAREQLAAWQAGMEEAAPMGPPVTGSAMTAEAVAAVGASCP